MEMEMEMGMEMEEVGMGMARWDGMGTESSAEMSRITTVNNWTMPRL